MELVDALEAAAGAAPLAEEVEADPSGTLAAAVERRGGMQGVSHGARLRRAGPALFHDSLRGPVD